MRSRRTGSRSIRALPPTLPPAISTCARRYVESEYYENRTGIHSAGRHHDYRTVGQPELFLPACEIVSNGRRTEASKDGEKGTSHAQNGVAESGRGRTNATSLDPAWSEPELPARERYAGLVATAWQ